MRRLLFPPHPPLTRSPFPSRGRLAFVSAHRAVPQKIRRRRARFIREGPPFAGRGVWIAVERKVVSPSFCGKRSFPLSKVFEVRELFSKSSLPGCRGQSPRGGVRGGGTPSLPAVCGTWGLMHEGEKSYPCPSLAEIGDFGCSKFLKGGVRGKTSFKKFSSRVLRP